MSEVIKDSANYRKLSEPFSSFDEANSALNAFFKDVRELRVKHKIPDVYIILSGSAIAEDGEEGEWIISQHHGNRLKSEPMTAFAYGHEQVLRQEAVAKALKGGIKQRPPQK